jgi:hypothetical protein
MKIRVAVVQSLSGSGADENRNAIDSLSWLRPRRRETRQTRLFPKGYAGQSIHPTTMMPSGPPAKATAEFGLHVIASHAVPYGAAHAVELSQNGTRVLAGAASGLM